MKPKQSSPKETFLDISELSRLEPKAAKAPFPDEEARRFKISDRTFDPAESLDRAKIRAREVHDPKVLAKWYEASAPLIIEEDDSVSPRIGAKAANLSFKGTRPDHLGFNPLPEAAFLNPRIREIFASNKVETRSLTFDISSKFYPWTTIGAIFRSYPPYTEERLVGTGFVFGGRVMFTARHVFPKNIHDSFAWNARWRFVPAYDRRSRDPEPFGSAHITIVRGKKNDSGSFLGDGFWGDPAGWDYAACKLDNRIGDLTGGMGMYCFGDSDDYKDPYFNSSGYPNFNGLNPLQEILVRIRDVDGGYEERELETENFAGPGWSGGPLFGYLDASDDTRVVGVCSGAEYMDSFWPPYGNCVWAGGGRMINLADYTVRNWWD